MATTSAMASERKSEESFRPPSIACRALLFRLGSRPGSRPWAQYLPEELRHAHSLSEVLHREWMDMLCTIPGEPLGRSSSVAACSSNVGAGSLPLADGAGDEEDPHLDHHHEDNRESSSASTSTRTTPRCRVAVVPATDVAKAAAASAASAPERPDQFASFLALTKGRVWALSRTPEGSRLVQRTLEAASDDEMRHFLAEELTGRVCKAMRCPHANHVVQKFILASSPEASQFIVDEVLSRPGLVPQMARHRYGCRILQHLLQRCHAPQIAPLVEALLDHAQVLACHPFGTYVIQQVLEHGSPTQCHRLIRLLERSVSMVVSSSAGVATVAAAIRHGGPEDALWLSRAVSQDPQVLLSLAQLRLGCHCVLLVLQTLSGKEQEKAVMFLIHHEAALSNSRGGMLVLDEAKAIAENIQRHSSAPPSLTHSRSTSYGGSGDGTGIEASV